MDEISYIDFDLLFQRAEGGFRAQANSPAGQATVTFALPFADLELENFLLRMGHTSRATRRIDSPEVATAKTFGERLFSALFTGEMRACLRSSIEEARRDGKGVRIRLHLTDTPQLADLPWEFLYNPAVNRFLGLSVETPLVRYLDLPERIQPLLVTPPLRVLVMISSPIDCPELDVEREWTNVRTALGDLEQRGLVSVERLADANLLALQRRLRQGTVHIFHFIGHGGFDPTKQDGVLVLEDTNRRGRPVSGQDLGTMFYDHRAMRLAVLNACEGARPSRTDPFAGTAQSLVQQGLAAVIAMQFEITDDAAITFAREFYGAVADGYPVDAALAEARRAIFFQGNGLEWGTPVLYLRAPDGRIFDVTRQVPKPGEVAGATPREAIDEPPQRPGAVPGFEVSLAPPRISVEPGKAATLTLTIRNVSRAPDRYHLDVTGADSSWLRLSAQDLSVGARAQDQLQVTIAPPRTSQSFGVTYPLSLRVTSQASKDQVTVEATLTIEPFVACTLDLAPRQQASRGAGRFTLTLTNNSNIPVTFGLSGDDPDHGCRYEFTEAAPTVRPGQTLSVPLRVRPKRRMLRGAAVSCPFVVRATPQGYEAKALQVNGQLTSRPGLPRWAAAALLACAAAVGIIVWRGGPVVQGPVIEAFTPSHEAVVQGAPVTVTWRVRSADRVTFTDSLEPALAREERDQAGTITVTPQVRGSHAWVLGAVRGPQRTERKVTIMVKYAKPEIKTFASSRSTGKEQDIELRWDVVHATSVKIAPGPGPVSLTGSAHVGAPPAGQTARYTLTASNPDNAPIEQSIAIATAVPKLLIRGFSGPREVSAGAPARLCYQVTNARSARIEPDVGELDPRTMDRDCRTVTPALTTTYTLKATGLDGATVGQSVTVAVEVPPPQVQITAQKTSLTSGDSTQLCWSVAHARSARIDPDVGELDPKTWERDCRTVTPRGTTTYRLTAMGLDGRSVSRQVGVAVVAPGGVVAPDVQIEFRARKTPIVAGESTALFFAIRNGQSARIDPDVGPLGATELQKGERVVSPKQTTVYTLTATGLGGQTIRQQTVVEVQPAPIAVDTIRIMSASPSAGTLLPIGRTVEFRVAVDYTLASTDSAYLAVYVEMFPQSAGGCTGPDHGTVGGSTLVNVARGERSLSVGVLWPGTTIRDWTQGYVGLAVNFFDANKRPLKPFGISPGYCYPFRGPERAQPASPAVARFLGEWRNADPNTRDITHVMIRFDGSALFVHMWVACHPTDCDWGDVRAALSDIQSDGSLLIGWTFSFAVNTQRLVVLPDGRLMVRGHDHFTDNSGRADRDYVDYFVPR